MGVWVIEVTDLENKHFACSKERRINILIVAETPRGNFSRPDHKQASHNGIPKAAASEYPI